MLKKVYSKIGALHRLKRVVRQILCCFFTRVLCYHILNTATLYLWVEVKHLTRNWKMRTIMNMGKSTNHESILRMADMNTLEHRRIEQSLMIFFKCFKENGPRRISRY